MEKVNYEIMLAYEPEDYTDDLPEAVAAEFRIGLPHTSNWPCFGVLALDFIRTLEWTIDTLPDDPMTIFQRFRDRVPSLRRFRNKTKRRRSQKFACIRLASSRMG